MFINAFIYGIHSNQSYLLSTKVLCAANKNEKAWFTALKKLMAKERNDTIFGSFIGKLVALKNKQGNYHKSWAVSMYHALLPHSSHQAASL